MRYVDWLGLLIFSLALLAWLGQRSGFLQKRPFDRPGVGYFRYFFSAALKRGLENTLHFQLGDEQGMEAFYSFAVLRWFRVAADLQVIEPGDRSFNTKVYAGISGQVRF